MRLRHLPTFRQTRRQPGFSANAHPRSALNDMNPLDFTTLLKAAAGTFGVPSRKPRGGHVLRSLRRFVPLMGEKFP